ncbi:glycosyltransferase [Methylocystis sp. H62]|nr:glycosyltransferase [Methylocystis sp. H62]MBG0792643.1 glycosyltransferase [Methylocystis sp. H62]
MLFNRANVRGMLYPLWKCFRKNKPDIVFSAEDHLNTIVLLAAILSGSSAKISGSSRVTPYDTYSTKIFTKRWVLKQVFRTVMWRANVLTCVSKDMVEQYRKVFSNAPHVCVYNIVDNPLSRQKMLEPVDAEWFLQKDIPVIVAAGQLEPWKGFADLIRAVKEVSRRRSVRLVIFGEGSLRDELERLIQELDLTDNVKLPGNVANPLKYFTHARVFALTSYVEGMPNALIEAMMCGCTPVATNCPTGPRELLDDGKFGYLVSVGDPISIASGIEQALEKPIDKHLLAEAIAPFEEQTIIARHFELLGLTNDRRKLAHADDQCQL